MKTSLAPLACRAAFDLSATAAGELMFFPAGTWTVTPLGAPDGKPITVRIDRDTAATMERQREEIESRGRRAYFDFNHEDGEASFWPARFVWKDEPAPGVYAEGEWSASGKAAVEGKMWRQFSPVFRLDDDDADPATVVWEEGASPNMGGLVNAPAFAAIAPLFAKAGAAREAARTQAFQTDHQTETKPQTPNEMSLKRPNIQITAESPADLLREYTAIVAKNAALPLNTNTAPIKAQLAREAASLFADIDDNARLAGMTLPEAIRAADATDAQVGLLSGTLALQKALDLLQYEYPLLSAISQDFAAEPGLYGQTETTHIVLKPAVQTYNPAADSAGRPLGWDTVSKAQMVPVSITLDEHVGVPVVFGAQTLAKTVRNLFAEVAPMALYALGQYAVNKLTALMTAANFNAYSDSSVGTGATTSGSTTVTCATTAGFYPGLQIAGTGIPTPTYVASVTNSTTAVLTQAATATGSGLTFTLGGGRIPTEYATYVKARADFNMESLGEIKGAFDMNEVPMQGRFALLNGSYHSRLAADPSFNQFFAATRKPEVITEGVLPRLQGFAPIEAPWFPSSNNRVGFAGHRAALMLKSRLPNELTSAIRGGVPGSVTTVTAPSGFSCLLVEYVSLQNSYAEWRPEVMLGAAVGDRRAGLVITSA